MEALRSPILAAKDALHRLANQTATPNDYGLACAALHASLVTALDGDIPEDARPLLEKVRLMVSVPEAFSFGELGWELDAARDALDRITIRPTVFTRDQASARIALHIQINHQPVCAAPSSDDVN